MWGEKCRGTVNKIQTVSMPSAGSCGLVGLSPSSVMKGGITEANSKEDRRLEGAQGGVEGRGLRPQSLPSAGWAQPRSGPVHRSVALCALSLFRVLIRVHLCACMCMCERTRAHVFACVFACTHV